jgi:hypothetical protein
MKCLIPFIHIRLKQEYAKWEYQRRALATDRAKLVHEGNDSKAKEITEKIEAKEKE